jgi:hypothetical protein
MNRPPNDAHDSSVEHGFPHRGSQVGLHVGHRFAEHLRIIVTGTNGATINGSLGQFGFDSTSPNGTGNLATP